MATRAQQLTTELATLQAELAKLEKSYNTQKNYLDAMMIDPCGWKPQWDLVENILHQLDETRNRVNLIQCELDSVQGLC
jgi:hypothetical protein